MISKEEWQKHNKHEEAWWSDCVNTSDEELKQLEYAKCMGLHEFNIYSKERAFGAKFDMQGKSILDIGGGPVSLLLKCANFGRTVVVDPGLWPDWVMERYRAAGIEYVRAMGEEYEPDEVFDEIWLYNTLQHVWNPKVVIQTVLRAGRTIRVFEWLETEQNEGHPHSLTQGFLDGEFGAKGTVVDLNWSGYPMPSYYLILQIPQPKVVRLNKQLNSDITVTITSCGRFDLLTRTVNSLLRTLGNRPIKIILVDDSENEEQHDKILGAYGDRFDIYVNDRNRGQAWCLDFLYGKVDTPYIFHCEDDWEFLKSGYIEKSLDILNECPDVTIIGLAKDEQFEAAGAVGDRHETRSGIVYYDHPVWRIDEKHDWWHGWIGSPHLMRKADYLRLGKFQQTEAEEGYDRLFGQSGMKSVWLEDQYVEHIGAGRSLFAKGHIWVKESDGNSRFRFHLLGLAHIPTHKENSCCAYSQKIVKLARMLKDLGHTVYFYGSEGSKVECDEFIQVVTHADRIAQYGDYDWRKEFFKWDTTGQDAIHQKFNQNAIVAIKERMQPKDFLLCTMGTNHKPIADVVGLMAVETGIGYHGIFADYKIFESYTHMHRLYGIRFGQGFKQYDNGGWYDVVIPNYFDPEDFPFQPKKDDYFLYIGRLIQRKGLDIACQVSRDLNKRLIVAGQGSLVNAAESLDITKANFPNVEHIGAIGPEERKEVMGRAKLAFVPTYYIEPFGGVAVELQMCGTPVLTTDWGAFIETVLHGVTGYRCRTYDDFIWAAKNIDKIDPQDCRDWAVRNYSMDRIKWMYQEYFEKLYDIWLSPGEQPGDGGWYKAHPERKDLNWLKKFYPNLREA